MNISLDIRFTYADFSEFIRIYDSTEIVSWTHLLIRFMWKATMTNATLLLSQFFDKNVFSCIIATEVTF